MVGSVTLERERNGSASPSGHRLVSLTGLLMNQKSPKGTSMSSDTSTSVSVKLPPMSVSDSDLPAPSLARATRFDEEPVSEMRRTGSFGALSWANRRTVAAGAGSGKGPAGVNDMDLRRIVFHHPRAKRLVSGLRVHAFSRQAFVSSFTVGLALGSVVAIILRVLKDVTCRMLYS